MIDTADLFQMWRAVRDGSMTAAEARAILIKTTGRFAFMERERHGGGEVRIPERLEVWNGHRPR